MIFRKERVESPGYSVRLNAFEEMKQLIEENKKLKKDGQLNRIPHKCPYCEQARFEIGIGLFFKCAPCNSTGVVWEPKL